MSQSLHSSKSCRLQAGPLVLTAQKVVRQALLIFGFTDRHQGHGMRAGLHLLFLGKCPSVMRLRAELMQHLLSILHSIPNKQLALLNVAKGL